MAEQPYVSDRDRELTSLIGHCLQTNHGGRKSLRCLWLLRLASTGQCTSDSSSACDTLIGRVAG
eukprot:m.218979 g.218979  ORF g.218979 m.218979 type:complete len:64 (-) comp17226_c0_seq11:256-447(-)